MSSSEIQSRSVSTHAKLNHKPTQILLLRQPLTTHGPETEAPMTTTREHPAAFRPRTTNAEAFVAVKAAIAGRFKRRSSRQLPEPPNLLPAKCRPETITSRSIAARHQPISLPSQKQISLQSESRRQYNTIKRQKPLSCRRPFRLSVSLSAVQTP